jgi:hypothetical protein
MSEQKPPIHMIPASALEGMAQVLEFGGDKYTKEGWRGGKPWTERLDSALRHIIAFNEGDDLDDESGLCHLDHAMCQLAFIREYMVTHPECDDRYATVARQELRDVIIKRRLDEMR